MVPELRKGLYFEDGLTRAGGYGLFGVEVDCSVFGRPLSCDAFYHNIDDGINLEVQPRALGAGHH